MKSLKWFGLIVCGILSGCGYQIRVAPSHQAVSIQTPVSPQGIALKNTLNQQFAKLGFKASDGKASISTTDVDFKEYKLIGVLTEIRIVATMTATYHLPTGDVKHTLTAERSYQYNEATIANQDAHNIKVRQWLQMDLARQTAEQYYALSNLSSTP